MDPVLGRYIAEGIVFGIVLLIVVWNVFFAPPGCAVSDVIVRGTQWSPLIPFLFGVLAGHLFWGNH